MSTMRPNTNSIATSIFVFDYENKGSASQCANVIASIFNTWIVPQLEEVITRKIPQEPIVHLDTIKIDIGTIMERELDHEFLNRIKNTFEIALNTKLNLLQQNGSSHSLSWSGGLGTTRLTALELYLTQGYLPNWIEAGSTLNAPIKTMLEKSKSDILWDTILMAVYRNTERSPILGSMAFPPELLALIEKSGNKKKLAVDMDKERSDPTLDDVSTNEIRINNAGLIIIWPFLTRLFEQLSMVKNGQFVDSSMQMRAIYALQYFVFGAVDYPEYELVLNKILVGMPIPEYLSPPENLSVEESKTIESLMNGLIQNWPKVHDSSPEGIQETFLQREGILSLGPENHKLTIPKKTVDILVESIPWNLSLIKLPWMQKPLHIEWI